MAETATTLAMLETVAVAALEGKGVPFSIQEQFICWETMFFPGIPLVIVAPANRPDSLGLVVDVICHFAPVLPGLTEPIPPLPHSEISTTGVASRSPEFLT